MFPVGLKHGLLNMPLNVYTFSILGNLALINQKKNAKISNNNNPFEEKRNEFNVSPYPLTKRISKYDKWDEESVK
eukprot:scaffold1909_cov51-Cyclotella_meneghiniana.AAC.1